MNGSPAAAALSSARLKSPALAFVGRHNSGKTTLVTAVVELLVAHGVDVGTVKHHGHVGFDVDVPGKDSWRHRQAGANEVAVCSPDRFALIRELDEQLEAAQIVQMMRPHDVVIVEGYRSSGLPCVEVMRAANERDRAAAAEFARAAAAGDFRCYDPAALGPDADRMPGERTLGVASDIPEALAAARSAGLLAFDVNDYEAIADYVERAFVRRDR
jgi:molybdopterin-guanine dinucleotide biosynthesis protein MobB